MSELKPFDYIGIINTKGPIPESINGHDIFLTNRNFSNIKETLFYANMINVDVDAQLNFDFYYYLLPKKKRFGKWYKKQKENNATKESLNIIMEYYQCSSTKAEGIYEILESKNILHDFILQHEQGGRSKS